MLDRLDSIDYGDGLNTNVTYSFDANGNRLGMIDRQGSTIYTWDDLNRPASLTHTPTGRSGLSLAYTHWPAGQLKYVTYPGSRAVSYTYDYADRLKTVTPWAGGTYTYDWRRNGQLDLLTNPNGTSTDYQYLPSNGRLSRLFSSRSGTILADQNFTYDPPGKITRITGDLPFAVPAIPTLGMTPDNANRLATIQGQAVTTDPAGRTQSLPSPLAGSATWEGMDWLSSWTSGGQTTTHGYNGDGVRTQRTTPSGTTRYLIDPTAELPNVVAESSEANAPQRFYIYGIGLLASIDASGTTSTYHFNQRGDTLALTNSTGLVTESNGYAPYGLTTTQNATTNHFRFAGQFGVMDEGNGTHFMRARFYSASLGRFISMDQLPGDLGKPQSLNRFAAMLGNPISNTDPNGREVKINSTAIYKEGVFSHNLLTIELTGVLISDTAEFDKSEAETFLKLLKRQVAKDYTGKSEDGKSQWKLIANLRLVESNDQIASSDHVFRAQSEVKGKIDGKIEPILGYALAGEKLMVFAEPGAIGRKQALRTASHELGHSLGLAHPEGDHGPTAAAGCEIRPNLLCQSRHSKSHAIDYSQIEAIKFLYDLGLLNQTNTKTSNFTQAW